MALSSVAPRPAMPDILPVSSFDNACPFLAYEAKVEVNQEFSLEACVTARLI